MGRGFLVLLDRNVLWNQTIESSTITITKRIERNSISTSRTCSRHQCWVSTITWKSIWKIARHNISENNGNICLQWCWRQRYVTYVSDSFRTLVAKSQCQWLFSPCWWLNNVKNRLQIFQNRHQDLPSAISVAGIDVAVTLLPVVVTGWCITIRNFFSTTGIEIILRHNNQFTIWAIIWIIINSIFRCWKPLRRGSNRFNQSGISIENWTGPG